MVIVSVLAVATVQDAAHAASVRHITVPTPGEPATDRARFMSCGYVAPILTQPSPSEESADATITRMLDRLGAWLRERAGGP